MAGSLEVAAVVGGKKVSKKTKKAKQSKVEELEAKINEIKEQNGIEEDPLMKVTSRVGVTSGADRRARALIWAHLLRIDLDDAEMRNGQLSNNRKTSHANVIVDQLAVLRVLPPLLNAITNIALAHNWLSVSLRCIQLQPALVQAMPPSVSPLAQLPGFDFEKGFEQQIIKKAEGDKWLEKWVRVREGFDEAFNVAKYWPRLEVIGAEFKVDDSKVVTPSSIVSLTAKVRYVYPTTALSSRAKPIPMLPKSELAKLEKGKEENGEAKSIEDVKEAVKEASEKEEKPTVKEVQEKIVKNKEAKEVVNGFAHAPRWPQVNYPCHLTLKLADMYPSYASLNTISSWETLSSTKSLCPLSKSPTSPFLLLMAHLQSPRKLACNSKLLLKLTCTPLSHT